MDGQGFDDLTRSLAERRLTRATALRGILAGIATAIPGVALLSEDAEAKKNRKKNRNKKQRKRKAKSSAKGGGNAGGGNLACPAGETSFKVDVNWEVPSTEPSCGTIPYTDTDNECSCTIEWCVSADGKTLEFGPGLDGGSEDPCFVTSVIVKGSTKSQLIPVNSTSSGSIVLQAPAMGKKGKEIIPAISNFSFCGYGCAETDCGPHVRPFSQDFETDTTGWFGTLQRVADGTDGVDAHSDGWFAKLPKSAQGTSNTRWGIYSSVFPANGYTTELAIYLPNPETLTVPCDTRFDYTSAINTPACVHRRDFVFNVGYYNDTCACGDGATDPNSCPEFGTGPRYVMSGSNNANRGQADPFNPNRDPFVIQTGGWYTFRHVFRELSNGTLSVDLILLDASGTTELHKWTLNDATDIIGDTVGGNRYGWIPAQEFPFLAIDTSSYAVNP